MPTGRPLSLPLRSRAEQATLADEAVGPLWRRALLLTAEPEAATAAVLAVAARLGAQIVNGRETVTLGRLLVMVRAHVVGGASFHRARRRRRTTLPPPVMPCLPGTDPVRFLAAQAPVVRAAVVLRFDERLLPAEVAAELGLAEPAVGPLLAAAATAWQVACPAPVPVLAHLPRLTVTPAPWGLATQFRSTLLEEVEPAYVTEVVWLS